MENSQKTQTNSQTEHLKEKFLKENPHKRDELEKILAVIGNDNISPIVNDLVKFCKEKTNFAALASIGSKFMDNTKNFLDRLKSSSKLVTTEGATMNLMAELIKNNLAAAIILNKGLQSPYNEVRYQTSQLIESRIKYLNECIKDESKAQYMEKNVESLKAFETFVFNDYHSKENAILFKAVRPELKTADKFLSENQILRLEKFDNGKSLELPEKTYFNQYDIENLQAIANGKYSNLINETMKFKITLNEQKDLELKKIEKIDNLNIPEKFGKIELSEENRAALSEGKTIALKGSDYDSLLAVDLDLNRIMAVNKNYAEKIIPEKLMEVQIANNMKDELLKGNTVELVGLKNNGKMFDALIKFDVVKEKLAFVSTSNTQNIELEKKNKVGKKI